MVYTDNNVTYGELGMESSGVTKRIQLASRTCVLYEYSLIVHVHIDKILTDKEKSTDSLP